MELSLKRARKWLYGFFALFIAGSSAVGVWLASGCTDKGNWNVLLITLDTTRADHLRCYGYENVETPGLNSMAREGVLFEHAYSHIPLTLPAHSSILTGTLPNYHGVRDNGGYRLRDEMITLAEDLKDHGYSTAAFISAAVLKKAFHLDQGFDYWNEDDIEPQEEDSPLVAERKGNRTTDAMLKWLSEHYQEKWFIWIHYYDPHQVYDPPSPYAELYARDLYAGEIAFMDSEIRRVFAGLKELGLFDQTLIVAMGDHGEGLNEHEELTHAMFIYNTTQWIPFLMRIPGLKNPGMRISSPVSQIDLMPTVLDLLSFSIPGEVQGQSLKPLIQGDGTGFLSRDIYMESRFLLLHFGWAEQVGIVSPQYKYIRSPRPELYDLIEDPHELHNLAERYPKVLKEMEFRLKESEKKYTYAGLENLATDEIELDEKTRKQLLALGYIPGQVQIDEDRANRKDPKDYKHLIPLFQSANQAFFRDDFQAMLRLTARILDDDPEHLTAIRLKGQALFGLGRYEEALAWYRTAIEILGEYQDAYAEMGNICIRINRLKEAREYLEKALAMNENDQRSRYYLGRIHLTWGDKETAWEIFQTEGLKDTALGHLGMAKYYENMRRLGRAEAEYEKAIEINDMLAIVYVEYCGLLLYKGEFKKALEYIEKAYDLDASLKFDSKFSDYYERAKKLAEPEANPGSEIKD